MRIPPSLCLRTPLSFKGTSFTRLNPVRWFIGGDDMDQVPDDFELFAMLEDLHCKRVLSAVPRLVMSLYEGLGVTDVVRLIILLYTALSK